MGERPGEGGETDALLNRVRTLRSKQNRLTSTRQNTRKDTTAATEQI